MPLNAGSPIQRLELGYTPLQGTSRPSIDFLNLSYTGMIWNTFKTTLTSRMNPCLTWRDFSGIQSHVQSLMHQFEKYSYALAHLFLNPYPHRFLGMKPSLLPYFDVEEEPARKKHCPAHSIIHITALINHKVPLIRIKQFDIYNWCISLSMQQQVNQKLLQNPIKGTIL